MTRDDIIRMAREAGGVFIDPPSGDCYTFDIDNGELERFAALVAAAEREECALVCEEQEELRGYTPFDCAAAIRARGQTAGETK